MIEKVVYSQSYVDGLCKAWDEMHDEVQRQRSRAERGEAERDALRAEVKRQARTIEGQNDEIARLNRWANATGKLRAALGEVEWIAVPGDRCPSCGNEREEGHEAGCRLAAALAECERAERGEEPTHGESSQKLRKAKSEGVDA